MAQTFEMSNGVLLTIPGSYATISVVPGAANLASNGVMCLVGEANAGPDYTLENNITQNFFLPSQYSAVLQKYQSGNLVDAFKNALTPSADSAITGSPSAIYIVKTNPSLKASYTIVDQGFGNYGLLDDKSWGASGNSIFGTLSPATVEVAPTTGTFAYVPSEASASSVQVRVNGGAVETLAVSANTSPTTLVGSITTSATGLNSLAGILATGGVNRTIQSSIGTTNTIALVAAGTVATITVAIGSGSAPAWSTIPSPGDTLNIPSSSVLEGAANANVGWYQVVSATATTIVANAISTTGALVSVSATPFGSSDNLDVYSPIAMQNVSGNDRLVFSGTTSPTLAGTAVGNVLSLTLGGGNSWTAIPQPNDLFFISASAPSTIATAAGGWYVVNSATANTMNVTRLSNGNPSTFGATAVTASAPAIQVFRPSEPGLGKALEIQDGGGAVNISTEFLTLTGGAVTFISTATTPKILNSSVEQSITLKNNRPSTNSSETMTAGGNVIMLVGYQGTTATLTIAVNSNVPTLTTTVTGGTGVNLSINPVALQLNTISSLVAYINSQQGYTAVAASALVGQLPVWSLNSANNAYNWILDQGTFGIASTQAGATPGRIKDDAFSFFSTIVNNSQLVQLSAVGAPNVATPAPAGLPDPVARTATSFPPFFLSGGAKGGTTNTIVSNALLLAQSITCNFVVDLFSQDASADAVIGATDPSSTYTIDAINALMDAHVLFMSALPQRGNRQAFLSKRNSFLSVQQAAQNIAQSRCSMCFQDVISVNSLGNTTQFQPWMAANLAAAQQAAGFYRGLVNKLVNVTGALQAGVTPSDFNANNIGDATTALNAGLLFIKQRANGGWSWVSDQTTYSIDNNFVYNSIQAVYAADQVALTLEQALETAFVGSSIADASAAVIAAFTQSVLASLKRVKLIGASDDAPSGYKNLVVQLTGPVVQISVEVKLDTMIYFIPISISVSMIQQTATA